MHLYVRTIDLLGQVVVDRTTEQPASHLQCSPPPNYQKTLRVGMLFAVVAALLVGSGLSLVRTSIYRAASCPPRISRASRGPHLNAEPRVALDRELDLFFETASSSGSVNISKLTPEQRMELAVRGEFLENEIFDAREKLLELENMYMRDNKSVDVAEITQLRDEIQGLKDDYIMLVGAKDLPLYFGRAPDALQ